MVDVKHLIARLQEEFEDYDFKEKEVPKNNKLLDSISIKPKDSNVGVVIYPVYFKTEDEIVDYIKSDEFKDRLSNGTVSKISNMIKDLKALSKSELLDRIKIRLYNGQKNEAFLSEHNVPYKNFLDLVAVFCIVVAEEEDRLLTTKLNYSVMDSLDITLDDLQDIYNRELVDSSKYNIKSMLDTMIEMGMPKELITEDMVDKEMYVCTNDNKMNGATALLCREMFKEFADKVDADLYIIPSSIHEILIVPINDIINENIKGELTSTIRYVNADVVKDEDFLSNTLYRYDRAANAVRIA